MWATIRQTCVFYFNSYLALKCVQTNTESKVGKFSCWSPLCVIALQLFTFLSFFFPYFSLITVGLVLLYSFWVFSAASSVLSLFKTALMQTVWDMFMFATKENSKQFFDQSWNEKKNLWTDLTKGNMFDSVVFFWCVSWSDSMFSSEIYTVVTPETWNVIELYVCVRVWTHTKLGDA